MAIRKKKNEWKNAKEAADNFEIKLKNLLEFCNTLMADEILNTEIASVIVGLCEEFITRCNVSMINQRRLKHDKYFLNLAILQM